MPLMQDATHIAGSLAGLFDWNFQPFSLPKSTTLLAFLNFTRGDHAAQVRYQFSKFILNFIQKVQNLLKYQ